MYQKLKPTKANNNDVRDIKILTDLHTLHPLFGVRRLADSLNWSQAKTRRIRNLAKIIVKSYRQRPKRPIIKATRPAPCNQLLKVATFLDKGRYRLPQSTLDSLNCWCVDFTYLPWHGSFLYLSAVFDLRSRCFLNFSLDSRHRSLEQIQVLSQALNVYPKPSILHSDQGVEYLSQDYQQLLTHNNILQSCSEAGKPWQNGHLERAFGTVKDELGIIQGYNLAELNYHLTATIYYYNHDRKHSVIKTTPYSYYQKYLTKPKLSPFFTRQNTLEKPRA